MRKKARFFSVLALSVLFSGIMSYRAGAVDVPDPAIDARASGPQSVILAGGCFWGMEEVFDHVKGVTNVTSGYTGGDKDAAHYESVGTGKTGHAEAVKVDYDPAKISLGQLLKVYFSVAHNPTEKDRQGPDSGSQYRSAIFTADAEQEKVARAYITQIDSAKSFSKPVATTVEPLKEFYPAEEYHQNYAKLHPNNAYLVINDLPKVIDLQKSYPDLYVGE